MALAKKGSRRITVDGVLYRWVLSPDDGYMVLVTESADASGQRLEAFFRYHDARAGRGGCPAHCGPTPLGEPRCRSEDYPCGTRSRLATQSARASVVPDSGRGSGGPIGGVRRRRAHGGRQSPPVIVPFSQRTAWIAKCL